MTGVDFISLGALTHSAPAADLGMSVHRDEAHGA
jgi:nicotinate-nucleotide pyrophosphorylase